MKTKSDVENIAKQIARKLGDGWSAQDTVMGAQLTGPGEARIQLRLDGQLVEVFGDNASRGEGVPEGIFPLDLPLLTYVICNFLVPAYQAYLADAAEKAEEITRWRDRARGSIQHFAQAAGASDPATYEGEDGSIETSFVAHDCRVDIRARYGSEDTVRITVPAAFDLGNLVLTWNAEGAA